MDCQLVPVCISYGYTTIPDGPPLDSLWILDAFRIDSLTIFQVFAMHSLWIPHGFPYGSPMDSIRIPYGFPMDFLSIYDGVLVDLQFFHGFPKDPFCCISSKDSLWIPYWISDLMDFRWIAALTILGQSFRILKKSKGALLRI